jgi:GLPGLI family protein
MKYKTLLLSFVLICPFIAFGQLLNIEYEFIKNNKENPALAVRELYLIKLTTNFSISEKLEQNTQHKFEDVKIEEKKDVVRKKLSDEYSIIASKNKFNYFKNYSSDSITTSSFIMTKQVFIQEKLDKFEWNILEKDTLYLENQCKIATTIHRGHTWTVFFAEKLGIKGGPWKLDGLPGLIVHAKTKDNAYIFNAIKIESKAESEDISNPFINEKKITWEDYKNTYKERVIRYVKNINAKNENGEKDAVFKIGNTMEDLGFKEIRQ